MGSSVGRQRSRRVFLWAGAVLVLAAGTVALLRNLDWEHYQADPQLLQRLQGATIQEAQVPKDQAGEWPQWRGPRRDGVSEETGLLAEWPAGGPPVLWHQQSGVGYSAVAVAGGRAYTLLQDGDDEAVVCWDADSGKELWRFRYPSKYENSFGSGPRSTPTIDGGRVYAVGATGLFHCLDAATGEEIWKHDLLKEFEAPLPGWGIAFSPLVEGKLVYAIPGGPHGNALAAFDKTNGSLAWKALDDPAGYSSPMATTAAGVRQILFFTQGGLVSVAPEDGKLYWRFPWETSYGCNIATPILAGDYVFISSNYDKGCALLEVTRQADGKLAARPVYQNNRMRNHFATSVLYRDHLYGFDNDNLVCMEFRTGKVQWKQRGFGKGTVLAADGRLIVLGESGKLALAEASPEGYREKSSFQVSHGKCWTVPVLAHGRLYVRDEDQVRCLDLRK